jgi:Ca2+/H+ antiporter, TMEM165/GDT1 family
MRRKLMWIAPLAIVGLALFVAIGGAAVRLLWNWLLPPLFGWPEITFWQALALLALCRILFGGFGMHGPGRFGVRRRLAERWERMTPEERERLRHGLHDRCGFGAAPSPGTSQGQ